MRRPVNQPRQARQTKRTIRNLLHASYPWDAPPNRTYDTADFIELAAVATGRGQSLAFASDQHPRLPDSDTFHLHLHDATPAQVFQAFQATLQGLLEIASRLHYLNEAVPVAIDRHNEPVYGAEQPWMVAMQEKAGTKWAHAYLTSQRLTNPRLTLDLELMTTFRNQHDALKDLLDRTRERQNVLALLLDKAFHNQYDLRLLLETGWWFVVAVPQDRSIQRAADGLYRVRQRVDYGRFVATRRHRVGDPKRGPEVVQVFVWEPDPKAPGGEALFVYACPHERPIHELDAWAHAFRQRWGIETGYRQLEAERLRTTSHVYANRLFLTLIAVLLDTAWRLLRHARTKRGEPTPLTLPQFRLQLETATDPPTA